MRKTAPLFFVKYKWPVGSYKKDVDRTICMMHKLLEKSESTGYMKKQQMT